MKEIQIFDKPVRKISNRGVRKNIGYFSSLKNGEPIPSESPLEMDYLFGLEIDKDVVSYRSQSVKICYQLNGRQRTYYPDVFENRKDENAIVEVKPHSKLEKNKAKFDCVETLCKENGFVFRVVTEKQIRVEPKLSNIKVLYRYARNLMQMDQYSQIMELFELNNDRMALRDVLGGIKSMRSAKSKVFHLIFHGFLSMDLMKPLDDDSEIWVTVK